MSEHVSGSSHAHQRSTPSQPHSPTQMCMHRHAMRWRTRGASLFFFLLATCLLRRPARCPELHTHIYVQSRVGKAQCIVGVPNKTRKRELAPAASIREAFSFHFSFFHFSVFVRLALGLALRTLAASSSLMTEAPYRITFCLAWPGLTSHLTSPHSPHSTSLSPHTSLHLASPHFTSPHTDRAVRALRDLLQQQKSTKNAR